MIFVLMRRTFGNPPRDAVREFGSDARLPEREEPRTRRDPGRDARRKGRGQTLVESAIILPLFALLMLGLFDLGRVVYAQHTLSQAAREAARSGVVEPMANAYKYGVIRAAAVNAAPGTGLVSGDVTGSGCSDCFYPDGTASGGRVVVNIRHSVSLLTPLISQIVGGSIAVEGKSIAFIP